MTKNINAKKILKKGLKTGIFEECVKLIISAYDEIRINDHFKGQKPLEEVRRNQLVQTMECLMPQYKFKHFITKESATSNPKTFNTLGRIDICVSYKVNYEQRMISFECKRFIKYSYGEKAIEKAYYEDGINRYEIEKYPVDKGIAGMISFFEEGDYTIFNQRLVKNINIHAKNGSFFVLTQYGHDYIYESKVSDVNGNDITLNHILLNFT